MSQSKTAVPLCQTLHWVFRKFSVLAQYFFIRMTYIDFQIRCVLIVHLSADAIVFASDSNINNVHATVNRELVGVDKWLMANRLSLYISKTPYITIFDQKYAINIKFRD